MLKEITFATFFLVAMQGVASAQVDWASWWRTHSIEQNCATLALSEIENDGSRPEADRRAFEAANWWANRAVAAGQAETAGGVLASLIRRSSLVGAALEDTTDPEAAMIARGLRPMVTDMKRSCNAAAQTRGGLTW